MGRRRAYRRTTDRLFCFSAKFVYVTVDSPLERHHARTGLAYYTLISDGFDYVITSVECSSHLACLHYKPTFLDRKDDE